MVVVIVIVLTGMFACVNLGNEFIVQWSNVLLDSNPEGNGRQLYFNFILTRIYKQSVDFNFPWQLPY